MKRYFNRCRFECKKSKYTQKRIDQPDFTIIGHRGSGRGLIENTLESIKLGFEQGANEIECDLAISQDNRLFLFHNSYVRTKLKKKILVKHLKLNEINQHQPQLVTFEKLISSFPEKNFIFELKYYTDYRTVFEIVNDHFRKKLCRKPKFISFSLEALSYIKSKNPYIYCSFISTSKDNNRFEPFVNNKHIKLCIDNGM